MLLLWLLAAILTGWSFGFTTMMGSDLWWHLASGRWIWENRTLNFKDPWSFTRFGQPWMSHEWFSDVIFHAWSRLFGMATLVWWKWSILAGAFVALFLTLRKLSGSSLGAYLAILLAGAVGAAFFDVRPQLYSLLGFAVLLRLALEPSRLRWLLPFGFFLWVNLHGGYFFGLATLTAIFAMARIFGEAPRNTLPIWLACLVACLANPSGPDAFVFPLHYALNSNSPYLRVGEWRPPWEAGGIRSALFFPSIGVFALSGAASFALRLHRSRPRLTYTALALGLFTLAMALKSRRFIPLFGMTQGLVLAPVLAALGARLGRFLKERVASAQPILAFVLPALAIGLGVWRLAPYPLSSSAFPYLTSLDSFPVEAMNVADANQLAGKVFAYYQWGGYLHLRSDGRLKVFIDGRADTVFDDQIYRQYTKVLNMAPGWQDIVDNSGAEYFLWPRQQRKLLEMLRDSGTWRTMYADQVAALLVRTDLPEPKTLLPSPDSPWREMTLGWKSSGAKDLSAAEQHFRRALEQMSNYHMACEWLANVQARSNRMAEAEVTLERCQKSFPDRARHEEMLRFLRTRAAESLP